MEQILAEHQERMARWEYMKTPEFQQELLDKVIGRTHADIKPPWED